MMRTILGLLLLFSALAQAQEYKHYIGAADLMYTRLADTPKEDVLRGGHDVINLVPGEGQVFTRTVDKLLKTSLVHITIEGEGEKMRITFDALTRGPDVQALFRIITDGEGKVLEQLVPTGEQGIHIDDFQLRFNRGKGAQLAHLDVAININRTNGPPTKHMTGYFLNLAPTEK